MLKSAFREYCIWCGKDLGFKYAKEHWASIVSIYVCSRQCLKNYLTQQDRFPESISDYFIPYKSKGFRSTAEQRFYTWAKLECINVIHEPVMLRIPQTKGTTARKHIYYIPDFYLPDLNLFIEVKYGSFSRSVHKRLLELLNNGIVCKLLRMEYLNVFPKITFNKQSRVPSASS